MREHPLKTFARNKSLSMAKIASAAGISRMTLHRVMQGENTTLRLLQRISAATGGDVSIEQLLVPVNVDLHEASDGGVSVDAEHGAPAASCPVKAPLPALPAGAPR